MDTKIFPIDLSENETRNLIERHLFDEFRDSTHWHNKRCTSYNFMGELNEDGSVRIIVTYDSDDGFMMSSGRCMSTTIKKPYSDKTFDEMVKQKMFSMAKREFQMRKHRKEMEEIASIHRQMFGISPGQLMNDPQT